MKKIVFIFLLLSETVLAQKGMFFTLEAYFPSVNLNESNLVSQQIKLGIGYSFSNKVNLKLNIGNGLMGNEIEPAKITQNFYSYGLCADYMFINSSNGYKIGLEALGDYNTTINAIYQEHFSCQGALKIQLPSKVFFKAGIQNRFLVNNATELIVSFGIKLQ
jgi:hypothetical protein